MPSAWKRSMRREHFVGVGDVPEGVRPDRDAAGVVDRLDRPRRRWASRAGGRRTCPRSGSRGSASRRRRCPRRCRRCGVGGGGEHGGGEVRAPDRFALGDARVDLGFVELEADLAQGVAHAQRALLAVGEEVDERGRSSAGRCGRCCSRGCAVRGARTSRRRRRRSRRRRRRARRRARRWRSPRRRR